MTQPSDRPGDDALDSATAMETDGGTKPREKTECELVASQLASAVALIEKNVKSKQATASGRVLRTTAAVRRRLSTPILQNFISQHLPRDSPSAPMLLSAIEQVFTGLRDALHIQAVMRFARLRCCAICACGAAYTSD